MLILLSPAKSMDFDGRVPKLATSEPRLGDQAVPLAALMATKSVSELASLAGISDELAGLNASRWAAFDTAAKTDRAAILAFNGDVYQGLAVRDQFGTRDYTEAQKTVRILSGLYGVLRPLDRIQPYRLEMGARLATERGNSLYQWWGPRITDLLNQDLAESPGASVVVNLASSEYFGAVQPDRLDGKVISPRFEDTDPRGNRKVISFFAKRARGEFAAWLVKSRARNAAGLTRFAEHGYRYDPSSSTQNQPVFVRRFADR